MKTEEQKEKEFNETWDKIHARKELNNLPNNSKIDGLLLAQQNKDFFGHTIFTIKFNDVPIRLVTEIDARNVIDKEKKQAQDVFIKIIDETIKLYHTGNCDCNICFSRHKIKEELKSKLKGALLE